MINPQTITIKQKNVEKLNITKGEWEVAEGTIENGGGLYAVKSDEWDIASTFYIGFDEGDAHDNAQLIADAGTTYNQCGFLPSELKAQKEELLEACNELLRFKYVMKQQMSDLLATPDNFIKAVTSLEELIQKYKSNE